MNRTFLVIKAICLKLGNENPKLQDGPNYHIFVISIENYKFDQKVPKTDHYQNRFKLCDFLI